MNAWKCFKINKSRIYLKWDLLLLSSTHWGNCILRSTVSQGQVWRSFKKKKGHRTVDLTEKSKGSTAKPSYHCPVPLHTIVADHVPLMKEQSSTKTWTFLRASSFLFFEFISFQEQFLYCFSRSMQQ